MTSSSYCLMVRFMCIGLHRRWLQALQSSFPGRPEHLASAHENQPQECAASKSRQGAVSCLWRTDPVLRGPPQPGGTAPLLLRLLGEIGTPCSACGSAASAGPAAAGAPAPSLPRPDRGSGGGISRPEARRKLSCCCGISCGCCGCWRGAEECSSACGIQ